jgi:hypothetical protein
VDVGDVSVVAREGVRSLARYGLIICLQVL